MKPYIIGLTGGIASGKTAVGAIFETLGAAVIDADVIARDVIKPGTTGFKRLKTVFEPFFDGDNLNRRALRERVFAEKSEKEKLDAIMQPLIRAEIEKRLADFDGGEIAVLVAPLLFESGLDEIVDVTVTVSADTDTRLKRILSRDGSSLQTAAAVINSQLTDAEREAKSDIVIYNNGDIKQLRDRASVVYNEICERIKQS